MTKVRHARAQHAAQSAKQPPDLCFLLQASINKLRIPACSLACRLRLGRTQLPHSRVFKVTATDTAVEPKVQQLQPTRARCMPPAHKRPQERQQPSSVTRTTRIQLLATSAACAYTARVASRSQFPGTKLPRLACRRKRSTGSRPARSKSLPQAV